MTKLHLVSPGFFKQSRHGVPSDRLLVIFESGDTEMFDFELDDHVQKQEGEDVSNAHLYLVESEKQKEHDSVVTGIDSSRYVTGSYTSGHSRRYSALEGSAKRRLGQLGEDLTKL